MREQLLRQALESSKTVSKKQRTKQDSQASAGMSRSGSRQGSAGNSASGSPITSRGGSRMGSRQATDDEASDSDSEGTGNSGASIDGVLSGAADNLAMTHQWEQALAERIDHILQRSRRRQDEREVDLKWYLGITQNHYAHAEITSQVPQLTKQFIRAAGSDSDVEAILALKCLSITVFTDQTEDFYETCNSSLKAVIQNAASEEVKAEALHALSVVIFVSGDFEYITDALPYLLEIVETDGDQVEAPDSAAVVAAALEAHQLLVSALDDAETLEELSQDTIEAFAAQLDSSAVAVTVAAGEAIALLYEKSWRDATPDDGASSDSEDSATGARRAKLVQAYRPYRNTERLLGKMTALARTSAKSAGRRDKAALKTTFEDAARSIENPRVGPRWSDATGWKAEGNDARKGKRETGANRMKVRVNEGKGAEGLMTVDRWWKFVRVREVRRCVGQGFMTHWAANEVVRECLTQP